MMAASRKLAQRLSGAFLVLGLVTGCQADPAHVPVTDTMTDACHHELGFSPTEVAWKACIEAKQGDTVEAATNAENAAVGSAALGVLAAGALLAASHPVYAPPTYSPPPVYRTTCNQFGYQTDCTTTSY